MSLLRAALLATTVALAATAAAQAPRPGSEWATKPVPVEVFAQFPQIDTPRLSPDGKWIAVKVRASGGQALAVVPLGGGKPELVARDGAEASDRQGDRQVRSWRWLDNDHLLVAITYRDNLIGQWIDIQRFAVYNRATKKVLPLAWDSSIASQTLLWASRDGTPHVLIQRLNPASGATMRKPEVIDVDADTGKFSVAQSVNPLVSSWSADEDGVVRLGGSADGDTGKVRVLYRAGPGGDFRTVRRERTNLYDDVALPSLLLRGGKAYAYSRKDGYRALYEFDLDKMAIGKRVFGVDGYDIGGALVGPDADRLEGVGYTGERDRVQWLDPRMKEIQTALEGAAGGPGNVTIASADRARETIIFRAARLGQSPGYYVFNAKTGDIGLLGWQNDTLKAAELNPVKVVRYPTGDGKQIEAVLTMPRHKAGQKNLALVVLPHGGPWARDDADWDPYGWAQAIAEMGYVVIQPNFRGSTGYGRAWEAEAEGKWGGRMSDDLNDAIPFLAGQGLVDPKRVCMFGWSYGGYASARAAQRDGRLYRCAIAGAAPVDMPAMVTYDKDYLGRYRAKQALGSASTDLESISPALHAGEIATPIMIVHGAKDQRVPVAQARGFVARLKKAGKVEGRDFVYLEQPQNTHNLLREADRVQLLEAVRDFLAKNNPA